MSLRDIYKLEFKYKVFIDLKCKYFPRNFFIFREFGVLQSLSFEFSRVFLSLVPTIDSVILCQTTSKHQYSFWHFWKLFAQKSVQNVQENLSKAGSQRVSVKIGHFSRRELHTCTNFFSIFLIMNSGYHNRNKKDRRDSPSSSSRPRSSSKTSAAVNNEANQ